MYKHSASRTIRHGLADVVSTDHFFTITNAVCLAGGHVIANEQRIRGAHSLADRKSDWHRDAFAVPYRQFHAEPNADCNSVAKSFADADTVPNHVVVARRNSFSEFIANAIHYALSVS